MLSESKIANAKPKKREYTLNDGGGLWLFVLPSRSKIWRFRYTLNGKQGRISIGEWTEILPDEARKTCLEYRRQIAHNVVPGQVAPVAFEAVACEGVAAQIVPELLEKHKKVYSETTREVNISACWSQAYRRHHADGITCGVAEARKRRRGIYGTCVAEFLFAYLWFCDRVGAC